MPLAHPPTTLEEVDTPAAVIDLDRTERNLLAAQRYCNTHNLKLRPHIKTHKLPVLAHKQLQAGAVGITAQKLGEAGVMAAAGLDDILLTYNIIGESKEKRLAGLASVTRRLGLALDNAVAVQTAARAARASGKTIGIFIEFESGMKRMGVLEPGQALTLAREVLEQEGLEFRGLMTYPLGPATGAWLARVGELFEREGIEILEVSGGGTPRMWHSHEVERLTELRVGTYVYHDRATVGAGAARLDDCALHVHATVVSVPERNRAVIDAGSKTLSSDLIHPDYGVGYGLILDYPEAIIVKLSEEHGMVDLSQSSRVPEVGERVRIVPNHACVVTNLHDEVVAHRSGTVEAVWPVWARGKTR